MDYWIVFSLLSSSSCEHFSVLRWLQQQGVTWKLAHLATIEMKLLSFLKSEMVINKPAFLAVHNELAAYFESWLMGTFYKIT